MFIRSCYSYFSLEIVLAGLTVATVGSAICLVGRALATIESAICLVGRAIATIEPEECLVRTPHDSVRCLIV